MTDVSKELRRDGQPGSLGDCDAASCECRQEALPRYSSKDLFGDSPCVVIEHERQEYRLRITRLGKLILTK